MPCDTQRRKNQTLEQRKSEVRATVDNLAQQIARRKVQLKVGPQGAIAFVGDWQRNGVSDACAYRRLLVQGNALVRAEIAKAERIAGRSVNLQVVGSGIHSHDGGDTWHSKG